MLVCFFRNFLINLLIDNKIILLKKQKARW